MGRYRVIDEVTYPEMEGRGRQRRGRWVGRQPLVKRAESQCNLLEAWYGQRVGTWGQAPTSSPTPSLSHPCQGPHRWVLAAIVWTMALLSISRSRALEAQPTTAGGRLLEKR